ncbi:molybdenum cofactor guanylyltransferase [Actinokineospora sp.]|uniref:molybdenum cofactor guanylyltransferase n=1 Tax=Actinokineospora sp. TaxID=1872133 RepID=UPI004037D6A6
MGAAWAAIVLAGGRGDRLGGVDKPALVVGGRSLLATALHAVSGADQVIVVGPRRPTATPVRWTREDEPGSGPVAALAAGVAALAESTSDTLVVLLAADLPAVTAATVRRLREAPGGSGVVLVDGAGRDQWLLSAWPIGLLRTALPARPEGAALRRVLGGLGPARLSDLDGSAADLDTSADLARFTR